MTLFMILSYALWLSYDTVPWWKMDWFNWEKYRKPQCFMEFLMVKAMISDRFSLKPIQWYVGWMLNWNELNTSVMLFMANSTKIEKWNSTSTVPIYFAIYSEANYNNVSVYPCTVDCPFWGLKMELLHSPLNIQPIPAVQLLVSDRLIIQKWCGTRGEKNILKRAVSLSHKDTTCKCCGKLHTQSYTYILLPPMSAKQGYEMLWFSLWFSFVARANLAQVTQDCLAVLIVT